jgi:hypothetical protein
MKWENFIREHFVLEKFSRGIFNPGTFSPVALFGSPGEPMQSRGIRRRRRPLAGHVFEFTYF